MAFDMIRRGLKMAKTAMDMRSSDRIRNQVDNDETGQGLDYMTAQSKRKREAAAGTTPEAAPAEPEEGETAEALKTRRRNLYGIGIGGGMAGRMMDKALGPEKRRRVNIGGE